MEQFLKIGAVTAPHGVRGEVKVFPMTDDPRRFCDLDAVILRRGNAEETRAIEGVKFFKNLVLLKLAGVDSMDAAEALRGAALYIPREQGVALGPNEYYTADLVGMAVYLEDGSAFGEVTDVMQTGANDVYVIQSPAHGEVLLPAIKDCVKQVDVAGSRMVIHLLPGLI